MAENDSTAIPITSMMMNIQTKLFAAAMGIATFLAVPCHADDPLPSWNDSDAKRAIVAFVETVTDEGSAGFVPVAQRIAVFDNDGTLWCENPLPFQALFAADEIKRLLPKHPEWKENAAVQAFLQMNGDD